MKKAGKIKWIIGIDEVGRGALAGPVVVAAAMVWKRRGVRRKGLGKLKDSKKLSPKKREAWFAYFKSNPNIAFAVARVYQRGIEKLNISQAANVAAQRSCERLFRNIEISKYRNIAPRVYLDGGLYLGKKVRGYPSQYPYASVRTIVRGDEQITAIKIASIIAKVHRDRFMVRLAKKYPAYGFDVHKGYGTKAHYQALKKYGITDAHRKTFCG